MLKNREVVRIVSHGSRSSRKRHGTTPDETEEIGWVISEVRKSQGSAFGQNQRIQVFELTD